MLTKITEYERPEAEASQEPLAGFLASLASLTPDGDEDGLQLQSDVLVPADECTFDEVRDAALRDKLRVHRGLPCAPDSVPEELLRAAYSVAKSSHLWVVTSLQAATGPGPSPPGLQAPDPERGRGRRTGHWKGPSGWREALKDEIARVFVEFGSTKMVPARRRRELIGKYRRGEIHTLRLVVPFKEKRNVDGAGTRKKARTTAGGLVSNEKIPGTFPANMACKTSQYMTQLELQLKGARTGHKDVGGGYFHGKQPDIEMASGRAIFFPIPPG